MTRPVNEVRQVITIALALAVMMALTGALDAIGLFSPGLTTGKRIDLASPIASPMASPMATPASTPIIEEDYPPLADVRDIQARPGSLANIKFSIEGVVRYIFVASEGGGYELGDHEEYRDRFRTNLGLKYALPNGETDVIDIGYHDDPVGVYEGDVVIIGGEIVGTNSGQTESGRQHVWTFMIADYIRHADHASPETMLPTRVSEGQTNSATPSAADGAEDEPLVISGTGNIVTEDFPLKAGRYEVTVDLASGCCISLYLYGPSNLENVLFSESFPGDNGGTVTDIYQVPESGIYFIDSRNTDADWTVTFKRR